MARAPRTATPPPADETKADKFKRLAQPRVSGIVAAIRRLPALAASSYESTPEQRDAMFGAIQAELNKARGAFQPKEKADKKTAFTF